MNEFVHSLAIITVFGLIYITILAASASLFHVAPTSRKNEVERNNVAQGATQTVIISPVASVWLKTPADVFRHVYQWIGSEPMEYLIFLLVTADNRLVTEIQCTDKQGGYVGFPDLEIILQHCRQGEATAVFIVHNHPHGTMYPSSEDLYYTARLIPQLAVAGIKLTDHVIVTPGGYYSIKDNDDFGVVFS